MKKILPKKLLPCFKRQGYLYKLIQRSGNVILYEALSSKKEKLKGYVVAKIRIKGGETAPNGEYIPPREKFPSPSDFGKYGWFYMPESLQIAMNHFFELCEDKELRTNFKIKLASIGKLQTDKNH